ncbi:MAG: orotate phosphoribosyltransferase, partial [Myxococcales bacterium]|nr:orotate phosphoribosyltransferase [Myxococcales bacterium]
YVDCKQTALHPEGAVALGHHMYQAVQRIEAQVGRKAGGVGGMTLGADPLATAVSLAAWHAGRPLPAFIVRKTAKGHGTGAWVEGRRNLPDGTPVIVLEDVVTTGGTTLKAIDHIREERLVPVGIVCILDRGAGGLDNLRASGLVVETLFHVRELT